MFSDVSHNINCAGLYKELPGMKDCTCGKIVECLLAERKALQDELYALKKPNYDYEDIKSEIPSSYVVIATSLLAVVSRIFHFTEGYKIVMVAAAGVINAAKYSSDPDINKETVMDYLDKAIIVSAKEMQDIDAGQNKQKYNL